MPIDLQARARHLYQSQTLASHGCDSIARKSRHRIAAHRDLAHATDHWLAASSTAAGQARLRLSQRAPRGVCRWLFLARLPESRSPAAKQQQLLDSETRAQTVRVTSALAARYTRQLGEPEARRKLAGGVSHRTARPMPSAPDGAGEELHHRKRSSYSTPLRCRSSVYSS